MDFSAVVVSTALTCKTDHSRGIIIPSVQVTMMSDGVIMVWLRQSCNYQCMPNRSTGLGQEMPLT